MDRVVVEPVATGRQRKDFLNFPWQLYRGDPHWVPTLRDEEWSLLNYSPHPFYEKNAIQTFLARRGRQLCGRIAAIHNQTHIDYQKDRRGFFGFFECVDDAEVAGALFDAAKAWLAERNLRAIRGPTNPGINYTWGTLVEGFDSPPTFMITYNKPYYDRLITGYGFQKAQDLYCYFANREMLPESQKKHWPLADQIKERFNVTLRPLNPKRFQQDIREFLAIYNRSMEKHWNFSPMSEKELDHTASALRHILIPELIVGGEIDGKLVAMVLVLPDYNPRIKRIDGRLWPFGFLRLLWRKWQIKRVRAMSTNVLPEYHLIGVPLVLFKELTARHMACGIEEVEYSWIAESNTLSWHSLRKGGAQRTKVHRVYDLA
jgi:hypothetical protein